jgi:glycosyltransferase involved in cell wall biosynthesis
MKVVHLSTTDIIGGASRGAYWLHRALREIGVESLMLVDRKASDDDSVVEVAGGARRILRAARARLDDLPLTRYRKTADSYWSVGWVPHRVERDVAALAPDVVHLHWINNGYVPIDALPRLGRPLVWTLRDMWAFTGGCHYTAGCERYRSGCGACPQLNSDRTVDLSTRVFEAKTRRWQELDLFLVPISRWLAERARSSPLFAETPMEVIPNGVDIARFSPRDRAQAKERFGVKPENPLIVFGAVNPTADARKGFEPFREAVARLGGDGWSSRAEVIVFGAEGPPPSDAPPMRFIGRLDNDDTLATLYSAADVTVAPSKQEAFGKTLIESFACATPVVAFRSGGPVDIVDHRHNGFLAEPFDSGALAEGIAWCLEAPERASQLGRHGRAKAETAYDIHVVAARYRDLYRRILNGRRAAA